MFGLGVWRVVVVGLVVGLVSGCAQPAAPEGFLVGPEPAEVGGFGEVEFDGGLVFPVAARSCVMGLEDGGTAQVFLGVDDVSNTSVEVVVTRAASGEVATVGVQNPGQNVPFLFGPVVLDGGAPGVLRGEVTFEQDGTGATFELDGVGAGDC